jgi:LPS-assembly protein
MMGGVPSATAGAADRLLPLLQTKITLALATHLEEHRLPSEAEGARFTLSDRIVLRSGQEITLSGQAEIRTTASVIKADRLHYDADTDQAKAAGRVRIIHNGNTFTGTRAQLQVAARSGYLLSPTYHFNVPGGSGSGQRIDLLDADRIVVTRGNYTGCQCTKDPAWMIQADRVELDTATQRGVVRNGVLFFQRIPLFASPYLAFPLSDKRVSGFLPPTAIVDTSAGLGLSLPYYWNIAPNRDLTLYPGFIARRGVKMGATYRYLSRFYEGTVKGTYLPYDKILQRPHYNFHARHNQFLGPDLNAYLDYHRVSDATYPGDLDDSDLATTGIQRLYTQEAGLRYQHGPWSAHARVQRWQVLPPEKAPYARQPELQLAYQRYDVGGFDMSVKTNYTVFQNESAAEVRGRRLTLDSAISYPWIRPAYFIVPKLKYHLGWYTLNSPVDTDAATDQAGGHRQFRREKITVPTLSLDSGLAFERSLQLLGRSYLQTLEPRLYYVYTPYRDQRSMPVFDTVESDFSFAELYSENTFIGGDRVADANRLTSSLTTRLIDLENGHERARFAIAQQHYFQPQRTTLGNDLPYMRSYHSDILVGAALKLEPGFSSAVSAQYNLDQKNLIRSSIGFGWRIQDRKVFNIAYRYTRSNTTLNDQPVHQAIMSVQWPFTSRFYGIGQVSYAFDSKRVVDSLLGFQYDADCWRFGLAVKHAVNGANAHVGHLTAPRILARLELKGLTRIGTGLLEEFRQRVPGYTPFPPPPPPRSRFSYYE